MEGAEYLLTSAEVAIALVGFSALVVAIRQRGNAELSSSTRRLVSSLIERGLVAAFLSFLPLLLSGLSVPSRWLWFSVSGMLCAYVASLAWRGATLRQREPIVNDLVARPLFYAIYGAGLLVIALQIFHALGIGLQQSVWWYLVGLTWLLTSVGYLFYFVIRGWARDP